jgi:shikimate dehydrogenase
MLLDPHAANRAPILVGLIGAGIQASLSPAMHQLEAARQGLNYAYRLLDLDVMGAKAEDLPALIGAAERLGFAGLNITFPCKQAVLAHLYELSPEARAIGAVNTVLLRDGKRIGYNTDAWGFARAFERDLGDAPRRHVVLLGAGGAGAAIAHALIGLGVARLDIVDRDRGRAEALVQRLAESGCVCTVAELASALRTADGLVHATPTGMAKFPGLAFDPALLRRHHWLAEVVYFPLETALLAAARGRGCRTMDGGGMAVFQAVRALELFTGIEPDVARMSAHFVKLINRPGKTRVV